MIPFLILLIVEGVPLLHLEFHPPSAERCRCVSVPCRWHPCPSPVWTGSTLLPSLLLPLFSEGSLPPALCKPFLGISQKLVARSRLGPLLADRDQLDNRGYSEPLDDQGLGLCRCRES